MLVGQEQREVPEFRKFYRQWDRCIAGIQPSDHIEIRPAQARIEDYFRAADLFVFLSFLEGMPNVIPIAKVGTSKNPHFAVVDHGSMKTTGRPLCGTGSLIPTPSVGRIPYVPVIDR